jgi:hypothetical protein
VLAAAGLEGEATFMSSPISHSSRRASARFI